LSAFHATSPPLYSVALNCEAAHSVVNYGPQVHR
jgi:hypothetical protein